MKTVRAIFQWVFLVSAMALPTFAGVTTFQVLGSGTSDFTGMGRVGGISKDGSVIVGAGLALSSGTLAKWEMQSFKWTAATQTLFLDTSFSLSSMATGVSDNGNTIVGWRQTGPSVDRQGAFGRVGAAYKTFRLNSTTDIWNSAVLDVSGSGTLAVGYCPTDQSTTFAPVAASWTITTSGTIYVSSYGDLPGGVTESTAKRISGDTLTVVGWGTSANGVEAIQIKSGTMTSLGVLSGGKYFSEANDVSTDGSVIVGRSNSANGIEAFRWTSALGMQGLGDLPGGAFVSEATGVSGDGTIIVGIGNSTIDADVFIWDTSHGMRRLAAVCAAAGIDLSGYSLAYCRPVISEDGDTIAGDAISPTMDQVMFRLSGVRTALALPITLYWQGDDNANTWDAATTANWSDGSALANFINGSPVIFDDQGSSTPAVMLTGTLQPTMVTVNTGSNYTFSGAGSLSGTMSLVKSGSGTLTLTGTHNYTGGTFVNGGTLTAKGQFSDSGNTGLQIGSGATLNLFGGAVNAPVSVASGGFLTGAGTINGKMTNNGTVAASTGGTLAITGTVTNNGVMRLTGGTLLQLSGALVNNGVIDVINGGITFPSNFVNNGTVLDAKSVRTKSFLCNGPDMVLTIVSTTGHHYTLQRSDSLTAGTWQPVGPAQDGAGGILTFSDSGGSARARQFYRIVVTP